MHPAGAPRSAVERRDQIGERVVAKIICPECNGKGGHMSSGDGWSEWDDCRCCDPNGKGLGGKVSPTRLAAFRRAEAAEAARWDTIIAEAKARGELD